MDGQRVSRPREKKSVWDSSVTVHFSMKEDMNLVLLTLADEKGIPKARIVQELIAKDHVYLKRYEEMREEGYFQ